MNTTGIMSPAELIGERVSDLPPLPIVVHRLLTLMGNENRSARDVVQVVENDAVLTARVLKVANSVTFSRGQTITSLNRAIVHLGEKMVVGIAIGSCTPQIFNQPLEGYQSAAGELWDHSLRTAIATREIGRFSRRPISTDLAFTAGLLHDVGKVVFSELLHSDAYQNADSQRGANESFLDLERRLTGTDHAEVGGIIAGHWNLPEPLVAAIRDHHCPSQAPQQDQGIAYAVHTADLLAMMGGTGTGIDTLAYGIDPNYEQYLDLNEGDMERIFLAVQEEFSSKKESIFACLET